MTLAPRTPATTAWTSSPASITTSPASASPALSPRPASPPSASPALALPTPSLTSYSPITRGRWGQLQRLRAGGPGTSTSSAVLCSSCYLAPVASACSSPPGLSSLQQVAVGYLKNRLLYPQHLDGIWTGSVHFRVTYDTLGEYPESWF